MATQSKNAPLALESEQEQTEDERTMYLDHGRTIAVTSQSGLEQLIELRAASGQVELRIRVTEDGPILQVDAVRLEVHSEQDVALDCRSFSVKATDSVELASGGGLNIKSEKEAQIESTKDVRVRGEKIWLN